MSVTEMFVNAYAKMHRLSIPDAIDAIEREIKKGPLAKDLNEKSTQPDYTTF